MPDHTRGGRDWLATGALNLENFIQDRGVGGVLLQFRCQAGDGPVPEDEYTYQVCVIAGPKTPQVMVRSVDTLFHAVFDPTPRDAVAGHILGEIRRHNEAFTGWRTKGGQTTYGERSALPDAVSFPADPSLIQVLETLRRAGRSVEEGPRNKWWVKSAAPGAALKIEAGLGQEPTYITRKEAAALDPEDIEHATRIRSAGTWLLVSGGLALVVLLVASALSGWNVYVYGVSGLAAQGIGAVVSTFGSVFFALLQFVAGWLLRGLKRRKVVMVLVILSMLPCVAPCCVAGVPLGIWVLLLLRNERSPRVFIS